MSARWGFKESMVTKKQVLRSVWGSKRPEEIEVAWLKPETTADNPELHDVLLQLLDSHGIEALPIGTSQAEARRVALEEEITARELRKTGLKKVSRYRHLFLVLLSSCGLFTFGYLRSGFLIGAAAFGSIGAVVFVVFMLTMRHLRKRYGLLNKPTETRPSAPSNASKQPPPLAARSLSEETSPLRTSPPPLRTAPPPLRQQSTRNPAPASKVPRTPYAKPRPNPLNRFMIILAVVVLPVLFLFAGYVVWMGMQKQAKKEYFDQHIHMELVQFTPQEISGQATIRVTNKGTRSIDQVDLGLRLTGEGIYPVGINKSVRFDASQEERFTVPVRITNRRWLGEIDVRANLMNLSWKPKP